LIVDRLPVDAYVPEVREQLRRSRALVLVAAPGAGKTTRLPPALIDAGPVILLQPRRVAARAVARRIASERGWTAGHEIGWQIRFEQRFSSDTRLLVVTEGILTARLLRDPLLSTFATVVLDEFHERSVHADIGLALARQAWLARDDLRILVMSATIEGERVSRFLGNCAVVRVPGTLHPLNIEYAPGVPVAEAVTRLAPRAPGHVLCFLPGVREIEQVRTDLASFASSSNIEVVPLHGSLAGDAQDEALRPSGRRRVIAETNIAETSLTVPGVSAVVDSGHVKVARYDAERGVDRLVLERVTQDSADQRAGRAARLGPGLVCRLWDPRDRLRPHREPDITRIDLAGPVLDLMAWGADPTTFEWFEAPPAEQIEAAMRLLRRIGAIDDEGRAPRLTPLGRRVQQVALHPRLARILLDAGATPEAAAACALLSEGITLDNRDVTTACDLLPLIDRFDELPEHVRTLAHDLRRGHHEGRKVHREETKATTVRVSVATREDAWEVRLRHALFAGYADRLAKRRADASDRFTLASGHGAVLAPESGVRQGEFVVALNVVAGQRAGVAEARIRAASLVEREWLLPSSTEVEHRFDPSSGRVKAVRVVRYDALLLSETPVPVDAAAAAAMLRDAWLARPRDAATTQLARRARFAKIDFDLPALAWQAALGAKALDDITIEPHLSFEMRQLLDTRAPHTLRVPSGRSVALEYAEDGSVSASVKLQELFGLADSPTIGAHGVPVTFHLLAPNGRPVQTTRDLRSFWERTYPEVRKELRGRYPKHPWPEDPWSAKPTHRTK
jgi:ATP-dependent helicase HrpB